MKKNDGVDQQSCEDRKMITTASHHGGFLVRGARVSRVRRDWQEAFARGDRRRVGRPGHIVPRCDSGNGKKWREVAQKHGRAAGHNGR